MRTIFLNPWNHVPYLEEMKHAYARRNGSIQDKVSELPVPSLMEFMIGEAVCKRLRGSNLMKEIRDKVRIIKEKNKQLDANIISTRCFPRVVNFEEIVIENYALAEPALVSFMCGVLNFVVPKELVSTQKRTDLIRFIAKRLLTWRAGTRLLAENESYPEIEYAVLIKEIRLNLPKIWAICNNDKYLAQELFDAISINLTHFLALYALHSLRSQTKIGLRDDVASFYFIPTYNEIKRHISVKAEVGKTRRFSTCSGDDSEMSSDFPPIKRESDIKHHSSTSSFPAAKGSASTTSKFAGKNEAPATSMSSGHSSMNGGASSSNENEDTIPPSIKRMKVEAIAENGHDWSKLKFPRDRPPDDIPVYDYTKVKRENFDSNSAQVEIESQISSDSLSNRMSAVDEWEDVLKSVNADSAIPEGYKMAFRCLVMSNRDLREHNRILRAQLDKG